MAGEGAPLQPKREDAATPVNRIAASRQSKKVADAEQTLKLVSQLYPDHPAVYVQRVLLARDMRDERKRCTVPTLTAQAGSGLA